VGGCTGDIVAARTSGSFVVAQGTNGTMGGA
jgi:hypothetical protein